MSIFNGVTPLTVQEFIDKYWTASAPPTPLQQDVIAAELQVRNGFFITTHGRGAGKTTVAQALARMWEDV